jgi:mannose-6-phosphate isomerase-like protein (cupin superfamily)
MKIKVSLADAAEQLGKEPLQQFTTVLQHGTMKVEYYKPEKFDLQKPHSQDELYIVASGSGTFIIKDEKVTFQVNDVLFVPAGIEHRFDNYTEDFATWVIFYGTEGGETSAKQ